MFNFDESWAPHEKHRMECVLASARVVLAASFLLVELFDGGPQHGEFAVSLAYLAYSVLILLILTTAPRYTTAFIIAVHVADMLWPSVIAYLAVGSASPIFVLYIFVLFAAAYRWGFRQTAVTMLAMVVLLKLESTLSISRGVREATEIISTRFPVRAAYLLVTGLFAGYLGEQQNRARAEEGALSHLMTVARTGAHVDDIIGKLLRELIRMFAAEEAAIYLDDSSQRKGFVFKLSSPDASREKLRPRTVPFGEVIDFRALPVRAAARAEVREKRIKLSTLHADNTFTLGSVERAGLLAEICYDHALIIRFATPDWYGMVALINNRRGRWGKTPLRFLQRCIHHIIPSIYSVDLNERLKTEAGAMERARLGRELHDGVVQSLFGLEMQTYLLRRQAKEFPEISSELEQMQQLIHEQLQQLREMVQQARTVEVTPDRLVEFISTATNKFANDTWISAHFESNVGPGQAISLPEGGCRELARIAHEAMVNVRKHSGAKALLIRLYEEPERVRLSIEDDGNGLEFQGRMTLRELEAAHAGPSTIKDCVRTLGADLVIESHSWKGTQIEVIVPKENHGVRTTQFG